MFDTDVGMGSSRKFSQKRSWDKHNESTQEIIQMMKHTNRMNVEEFLVYQHALRTFYTSWYVFKEVRPVTAHILEELFGVEEAKLHFADVSQFFTEGNAVSMVRYVENIPKIAHQDDFMKRISLLASQVSEEE
tara:strand:- start:989 stop:1387 length:399 start_codon:yes stop_codon:yes gene_type:complete